MKINNSEKEYTELLQNLLDDLIHLLPNAQTGSVLVKEGNALQYKAVKGYDLEKLQKMTLEISRSNLIFASKKVNLVTNLKAWDEDNLNSYQLETLIKHGRLDSIKSMITFPLTEKAV